MIEWSMKRLGGRACEFIIGAYFVFGALPKAADINRFSVQMSAYHVIPDKAWLPWFALATLFVEMALGTALMLGLRLRGLTVIALQVMLVFFTALIVYAWLVHGLEDCGCFPLVKMTPPVSIAKNILLFLMGLFVWRALVRRTAAVPDMADFPDAVPAAALSWRGASVKLLVAVVAGVVAVGYAAPRVERIAQTTDPIPGTGSGAATGIDYGQFVFETNMSAFDLGKGTYLVPILSMTCEECMGKVPQLNELMSEPGMPPMVALCYEDSPGDLQNFQVMAQPMFPLHALGDQPLLYYNLRGEDPFRLSLVRDGRAVKHWDGKVPSAQEVVEAIDKGDSPPQ